ncbi:MAG: hypothetical protein JJE25_11300, partial [Bacteroidia bacterium]|nr:hypothetical protein [Bacteroidia bacterium]
MMKKDSSFMVTAPFFSSCTFVAGFFFPCFMTHIFSQHFIPLILHFDKAAGGPGKSADGFGRLAGGSGKLADGSGRLPDDSGRLAGGSGRLADDSG